MPTSLRAGEVLSLRVILSPVLEQAKMRTLPLVNRTVELAPAAQACCGVCRTCATTNLLTLAGAAAAAVTAGIVRVVKRLAPRP